MCDIKRGKRLTKSVLLESGKYEVYHGSTTSILGYYNDFNVTEDTVIVVNTGGIGGVKYIDKCFWCSDGCFYLKGNETINNKFLYYFLSQYTDYFIHNIRVGGVPTIDRLCVEILQIPIPPLPVQEEIVRILDLYNTKKTELIYNLTKEREFRNKQYTTYRDKLLAFNASVVEMKALGEIATIVRGASPRPIKHFVTTDKTGVNWIKIGDTSPGSKYITTAKEKITTEGAAQSRFVKKGDFILSNSMSFGRPYILKIDGCIHDGWLSISDFEKHVTSDYLYYILVSSTIQKEMAKRASFGGAVQNLNADIVREIKIPVPSLDIQKRIVDTLDNFDKICTDLNIGLPAEIEARQKEYEFYRNELLSFDYLNAERRTQNAERRTQNAERRTGLIKLRLYVFGCVQLSLKDVCKIKNGSDWKLYSKGNIPVYGSGGIVTHIDTFAYDKPTVLIPRKGSVDKLYYTDQPFWNVDTIFYTVIDEQIIIPKYLFYLLQSKHLEQYNKSGGVPSLTQDVLNKIVLDIPSLEEQRRIVSILDKFNKLCNDFASGIPAEIEAIQKVYEYHRNKLLSFK